MWRRWAMVGVLVIVGGAGWAMVSDTKCDGYVAEWIADEGGCATTPMPWEYLYPWHWGAPDRCLGMCHDEQMLLD